MPVFFVVCLTRNFSVKKILSWQSEKKGIIPLPPPPPHIYVWCWKCQLNSRPAHADLGKACWGRNQSRSTISTKSSRGVLSHIFFSYPGRSGTKRETHCCTRSGRYSTAKCTALAVNIRLLGKCYGRRTQNMLLFSTTV